MLRFPIIKLLSLSVRELVVNTATQCSSPLLRIYRFILYFIKPHSKVIFVSQDDVHTQNLTQHFVCIVDYFIINLIYTLIPSVTLYEELRMQ